MDGLRGVTLLLGPTNTGKTHRAVERMLDHASGMIGLPLRLLAREVYDRVTARLGEREVALVTGEEQRVPRQARYWVCTVEAMPLARDVDFLAVDEIQLMAHPERGHVFTDRLLHARGRVETWFMGSDAVRDLATRLVPAAQVRAHPRLSRLLTFGSATLSALPPRTAIVAFSAARVYELAERVKERKGGAAVVLGALSPRARNAQVALYQSGEVDYLVATDAIGMGLNLDVLQVAFADVQKFDGKESRTLELAELAQIAGRAGRYLNDGRFGTLAPLPAFSDRTTRALEEHVVPPQPFAYFRNSDLELSSLTGLLESLAAPPRIQRLKRIGRTDDEAALRELVKQPEIRALAANVDGVRLLWEVCRIPNYRSLWVEAHVGLLAEVFLELSGPRARLDADWLDARVGRLDDVTGDIEGLLARMADIRSFTYISHRAEWVGDARHWQERSRQIEDRLSDALHERLVQRFVERRGGGRTAIARGRAAAPPLAAHSGGSPPSEDHPFARLMALRDRLSPPAEARAAADDVNALVEAAHDRFRIDADGRIHEGDRQLGRITRGTDPLRPEVVVTAEIGAGSRARLQRRLVAWTRDWVSELLAPMRHPSLSDLSGAARGLSYQLEQHLGTLRASDARAQVESLSGAERESLERLGVRFGRRVVHVPSLLSADALRTRSLLLRTFHGRAPEIPPDATVAPRDPSVAESIYCSLGFLVDGSRIVRADLYDRLAPRRRRRRRRRAKPDSEGRVGG
jgi:ATP-dependent RNA helicase SUPV3L1/SUV3